MSEKLGILGRWIDPVAQLQQDVLEEARTRFVELRDVVADIETVDRVLVMSQEDALAHLDSLLATRRPCRILLRRWAAPDDRPAWQDGLAMLGHALDASDTPHLDLAALTEDAAAEISALLGRPVTPLPGLPRIETNRPRVAVRRDAEDITFPFEHEDGRRETRRAGREAFNWVRLRRLGQPVAGDAGDADTVDLCAYAEGTRPPATDVTPRARPCIVAVVPNGVGLGHITRMMAVGKALQRERDVRLVFWSYSRAAEILQAAGFEVVLRQNAVHLKAHPPHWRHWEAEELARLLRHFDAQAVAYDGGGFDPFIVSALRAPGCGRIGVLWVRRGMMRPDTDAEMLESEQFCDLVIEPGDLAVEMDKGPTRMLTAARQGFSRHFESAPTTLKPYLPVYSRREARKRLKLGWGKHVLVSLGGAFGDWTRLTEVMGASARRHGIKLIWAKSPLAPPPADPAMAANVRHFYPLSRYLEAFDGMITATGYNSYHELMMGYDRPVLLAPTNNVRLDDQVARATWAADRGWAHLVRADDPDAQQTVMDRFMGEVRAGTRTAGRPGLPEGDPRLAEAILTVCDRYA